VLGIFSERNFHERQRKQTEMLGTHYITQIFKKLFKVEKYLYSIRAIVPYVIYCLLYKDQNTDVSNYVSRKLKPFFNLSS